MTFERQILAAEGFSELGMPAEALAELDKLSLDDQDRPEAIRMRVSALMQMRDWSKALILGLRMCELFPEVTFGYIHAAYCLHELGQTDQAKQMLLDGPATLLEEAVYYYNLACYDAALGNTDQAKAYLRASFRLDKSFREMARKDPDLAPIRDSIE